VNEVNTLTSLITGAGTAPTLTPPPTVIGTSVGKFKKITLREQFANWKWET